MRRFMTSVLVAVALTAISSVALADNQEMANQIAGQIRQSGQLKDYKIGVKYQEGTTWLTGRVRNQEQLTKALRLVLQMPNVKRVINNLEVAPAAQSPATTGVARQAPTRTTARLNQPLAAGPARSIAPRQTTKIEVKGSSQIGAAQRLQRTMRQPVQRQPVETAGKQQHRGASNSFNRAHPVPTSFTASPAQPTAHQSAPRQMARRPMPTRAAHGQRPVQANYQGDPAYAAHGAPRPMFTPNAAGGVAPVRYDQAYMPNHAWPSYAAYPNYAAVTYPRQYSPTAWPYIGPFYPYPQVPLGWRKVTLEWDDGWWMLDFKDR